MARWPRNITSHKQILLDTVLYSSVEQNNKKHWRQEVKKVVNFVSVQTASGDLWWVNR